MTYFNVLLRRRWIAQKWIFLVRWICQMVKWNPPLLSALGRRDFWRGAQHGRRVDGSGLIILIQLLWPFFKPVQSSARILCLMMTESVRFPMCAAQMVHSNPDCVFTVRREATCTTHMQEIWSLPETSATTHTWWKVDPHIAGNLWWRNYSSLVLCYP